MDYLHFMALSDEEFVRLVLDEEPISPAASEHLERCQNCQQRLAMYKQSYTSLVSRLYRCRCPSGTRLSLYCADLLSADEQMSIADHLLFCPLCAAEAADTRRFLAEAEPLPALTYSLRNTARRIVATLIKQQVQLAVREDVPETAWPRHYEAESIDLLLQLSRASDGEPMVLGTITDADSTEHAEAIEGAEAELYSVSNGDGDGENEWVESPHLYTQVDDLGNFVFFNVPAGNYVLMIHLPGREVVIEGLILETFD